MVDMLQKFIERLIDCKKLEHVTLLIFKLIKAVFNLLRVLRKCLHSCFVK